MRPPPWNGSPDTAPSRTRLRPPIASSCSSTAVTGSASPAAALRSGENDATWYLIRADVPSYALTMRSGGLKYQNSECLVSTTLLAGSVWLTVARESDRWSEPFECCPECGQHFFWHGESGSALV